MSEANQDGHENDKADDQNAIKSVLSSREIDRKQTRDDEDETDQPNDSSTKRPQIALPAGLDRLSKWAARLFDPDRPRGLIQPPQSIPLNDEFLREFGRREKHTDEVRGVQLEIDRQIDDPPSVNDNDDNTAIATDESAPQKPRDRRRKVKIVNLSFTSTSETLEKMCAEFGPIETVNLIMNTAAGDNRNAGHGYVLYTNAESARNCVDNLKQIDGRNVVVTLASSSKNASNTGTSLLSNRYWDASTKDLSTRCFHCGNIGHIAADCTNDRRIKPCPLCADLGHHDQPRLCPMRNVCFTCGVPGHVSRECRWTQILRRNPQCPMPRRIICTVCYDHRHHRSQCRAGLSSSRNVIVPPSAPAAVCFTCGNVGHYMCKSIEWRFGLRGISCANCGLPGHNVFQCTRPNLDQCARSNETWQHEIERASTVSFVEEYIVEINKSNPNRQQAQRSSQQKEPLRKDPRGRSRDQIGNHGQRGQNRPFHSMPPPRKRSNGNPNPPSPSSQANRQTSNMGNKNNNKNNNDRDPRKRSSPSKNNPSTPPPQKKQKNRWKSPPHRAESR